MSCDSSSDWATAADGRRTSAVVGFTKSTESAVMTRLSNLADRVDPSGKNTLAMVCLVVPGVMLVILTRDAGSASRKAEADTDAAPFSASSSPSPSSPSLSPSVTAGDISSAMSVNLLGWLDVTAVCASSKLLYRTYPLVMVVGNTSSASTPIMSAMDSTSDWRARTSSYSPSLPSIVG